MTNDVSALVELLSNKPILSRKDLARRYNRTLRTIDSWHAQGVIPKAFYLPGCAYPFWRPLDIIKAEKKQESLFRAITTARHDKTPAAKTATAATNQLSLFAHEPTQAATTTAKETAATTGEAATKSNAGAGAAKG